MSVNDGLSFQMVSLRHSNQKQAKRLKQGKSSRYMYTGSQRPCDTSINTLIIPYVLAHTQKSFQQAYLLKMKCTSDVRYIVHTVPVKGQLKLDPKLILVCFLLLCNNHRVVGEPVPKICCLLRVYIAVQFPLGHDALGNIRH